MSDVNRAIWGEPVGIPEGSHFYLQTSLKMNGINDTVNVTSSGTYTLTVQDSVLNGGTALLSSEASDSKLATNNGLSVAWDITNTQSAGWEAGEYPGDIKCVDSGGSISYWPVTMKIRSALG